MIIVAEVNLLENDNSIYNITEKYFLPMGIFYRIKKLTTKKIFVHILVALLFFLCALVNTYPLIKNIKTHQLGDGGDGLEFLWNLWWAKTSLVEEQQTIYHTDHIFYPNGVDLYLHSLSPLNGLISIPLQYIFSGNIILVYNILAISHFVLSGFSMFMLASHFSKSKFAAFIGGFIFAFCPYVMGHSLGHLNLLSIGFMPLFILFYLKFHESPSINNMLLSSVFLILNTLSSFYYGLFMIFFSFIYELFYIIKKKFSLDRKFLLKLVSIFFVFFVVLSPLILGTIRAKLSGDFAHDHDPDYWSSDIASFFMPGTLSVSEPVFRSFNLWRKVMTISRAASENQNFLGYTVLSLAVFGLYRLLKKKSSKDFIFSKRYYSIFFAIFAFITSIFVLGTKLKFLGNDFDIKLPYYFVFKIIPLVSVPGRFVILTIISLSILAVIAISSESKRLNFKLGFIYTIILFFVFIEFATVPYDLTLHHVPKIYEEIAQEQGDFAIYYFCYGKSVGDYFSDARKHMYYQTIHNKKISDGRISRNNMDALAYAIQKPNIHELLEMNVKYMVIPVSVSEEGRQALDYLNLGEYPLVYEDEEIIVYKIQD